MILAALSVAAQGSGQGAGVPVPVPPWRAAGNVGARAGGTLMPHPPAALSIMAAGAGPESADRLRAAGVLAVLPADGAVFLCDWPGDDHLRHPAHRTAHSRRPDRVRAELARGGTLCWRGLRCHRRWSTRISCRPPPRPAPAHDPGR